MTLRNISFRTGERITLSSLYEKKTGKSLVFKNNFTLNRGVYELVAVLSESVSSEPYRVEGTLIDLFDHRLPVYKSKDVMPGEQGYFLNVDKVKKGKPQVLASASREYDEKVEGHSYSYIAKSPINTTNISRVLLPAAPVSVTVDGAEVVDGSAWDADSMTYLLSFENNPDGVKVEFKW